MKAKEGRVRKGAKDCCPLVPFLSSHGFLNLFILATRVYTSDQKLLGVGQTNFECPVDKPMRMLPLLSLMTCPVLYIRLVSCLSLWHGFVYSKFVYLGKLWLVCNKCINLNKPSSNLWSLVPNSLIYSLRPISVFLFASFFVPN